jgi:hypothetical protein
MKMRSSHYRASLLISLFLFQTILIITHEHQHNPSDQGIRQATEQSDIWLLADGTCIFQFSRPLTAKLPDLCQKALYATPLDRIISTTKPQKINQSEYFIPALRAPPETLCS